MHLTTPSGESQKFTGTTEKKHIGWIFVRGTVLLSAPAVRSAPGEFKVLMQSSSSPTLQHGDSGRLAAHLPGPQLFFAIGENSAPGARDLRANILSARQPSSVHSEDL